MTTQPLISIVTVSFNAVETIEQTILSVVNQTYSHIEYIVIDGGSTDGTVDIIKKYSDKIAYWVSESDRGIYDAMNKGIEKASGDYIYFIGSDDQLLDNAILQIAHRIDGKAIYYGNVYMVKRRRIYNGRFSSFQMVVRNIPHQATFYPTIYLKTNSFNLRYKYLADYYLNLKAWKEINFKYVPIVIAKYNDDSTSSNCVDSCFEKDRFNIMRKFLPWYCYPYIIARRIRTLIKVFLYEQL